MLIDPAALPHLAMPFMNQEHAEEARLLNAAADAVAAFGRGELAAEQVGASLGALYEHTRAHFAHEEAAMSNASFPAFPIHRAEHVRLLGELGEAERKFRETGRAEELGPYLSALPAWLNDHIRSMDAATARYVAEWGG